MSIEIISNFLATIYDLPSLVQTVGYFGLAFIIFAETGLFFGFFLPGDSLLLTAGVFAAKGTFNLLYLNLLLITAAIVGDAFGYYFGKKTGKIIFKREESFLFKKSHLEKAKKFYEEHGGKAIILGRFIPVVRTFVPIVAGSLEMPYKKFFMYNVLGGIFWVASLTLLGYFVGEVIDIEKNLVLAILIIIALSFVPYLYEYWKSKKKKIQ